MGTCCGARERREMLNEKNRQRCGASAADSSELLARGVRRPVSANHSRLHPADMAATSASDVLLEEDV